MFSSAPSTENPNEGSPKLVIATRLHLGKAKSPPEHLQTLIDIFEDWTSSIPNSIAVIAVDATPRFPDYDYVEAVRECCTKTPKGAFQNCKILPVTPWGKFAPALNALVSYSLHEIGAQQICFVSAEVTPSIESIRILKKELQDPNVLVAGAQLPGHEYFGDDVTPDDSVQVKAKVSKATTEVRTEKHGRKVFTETVTVSNTVVGGELNGRTCPWNTLAVWNLPKLALTGFPMVTEMPDCAGVEECVTIALQQKLFGDNQTKAILVRVPDVDWEVDEYFQGDPQRKKWHDTKMKSKLDRAAKQMKMLSLEGGIVIHK